VFQTAINCGANVGAACGWTTRSCPRASPAASQLPILGSATAEQKNGWRTKKFYGSDHCPILLCLSEAERAAAMVCTPAEEDGAAAAEAEWSEDERYLYDTP
jgi:hypothetical protein